MLSGSNLNENWRAVATKFAQKQIRHLPAKAKEGERMWTAIDELKRDPFRGDVANLGGERWRKRAGNYRIMYNLLFERRIIYIYDVRRRTSNTYSR